MQKLVWSDELARIAQTWADQCDCVFQQNQVPMLFPKNVESQCVAKDLKCGTKKAILTEKHHFGSWRFPLMLIWQLVGVSLFPRANRWEGPESSGRKVEATNRATSQNFLSIEALSD